MSDDSPENKPVELEAISRIYNCPKCKSTHTIRLPKNVAKNKPSFPFPFVFLHSSEGDLEDLLTILYIDVELHIRAVEIIEVENSNIFSEDLTKQITEKLMDKIVNLEDENLHLKDLLKKLQVHKLSEFETHSPKIVSIPRLEAEAEAEEELMRLEPQLQKIKEIEKVPYIKEPLDVKLKPPVQGTSEKEEFVNVYIVSIMNPGKKIQDLTINLKNKISELKKTVGNIFNITHLQFHLSSGGITFDEDLILKDYNLDNGDEIVVIPSRVVG